MLPIASGWGGEEDRFPKGTRANRSTVLSYDSHPPLETDYKILLSTIDNEL